MEESIEQYKLQLKQVEDALQSAKDISEIESLRSLKSDLEELIDLTKQTINQEIDDTVSSSSISVNNANSNPNSMDNEINLFMSEIHSLEAQDDAALASDCDTDEKFNSRLQAIKDELEAMVGQKCSAPHDHSWGARVYHNAIICGLDDTRDYDLNNIKDFRLRILFTNPTHKEMIPCGFFLDGNCRFDVDKCRFSHGELVPFGELREYKEPEFNKLKRNCIVLAKMNDKIWHKGRVLCVNFVEKSCRVKLENKKRDEDFNFEDLFPILNDNENDDSSSTSDSEDETDEHDVDELRNAFIIERTLLTPAMDQALGEWEKHTRGIGSKLMQKMGYIVGAGLGSRGEGIIVPISAQILPPGRSLDHCMELREAANGDKNLFSVERKLDIQKKKQEAINAKNYERGKQKTDIFSFLNDNILSTGGNYSKLETNKLSERNLYKNHSIKNLNVESLKIAEDIRRKEREIQRLQESMQRHSSGSDIHNKMKYQLSVKNQELSSLKKSESHVAHEQQSRRHKDKMAIF